MNGERETGGERVSFYFVRSMPWYQAKNEREEEISVRRQVPIHQTNPFHQKVSPTQNFKNSVTYKGMHFVASVGSLSGPIGHRDSEQHFTCCLLEHEGRAL